MNKLALSSVVLDDVTRLATLESRGVTADPWDRATEPPDEATWAQLGYLTSKLAKAQPTTLNEATIWSRAVYPLLELAETERVRAWSEVPLSARDPYSGVEIVGVVDGVLAPEGVLAGAPGLPFFLVVEGKRGMDATDPRPQLIAALLAVIWSSDSSRPGTKTAYGCFTVGDIWTFVRAEALPPGSQTTLGGGNPKLNVILSWSREHTERFEAEAIFRILRWIAVQSMNQHTTKS